MNKEENIAQVSGRIKSQTYAKNENWKVILV